jgi:hypothetical protein
MHYLCRTFRENSQVTILIAHIPSQVNISFRFIKSSLCFLELSNSMYLFFLFTRRLLITRITNLSEEHITSTFRVDESATFLRNIDNLQDYIVSQPRRTQPTFPPP